VAKYAVTFDEWDACVAEGGCNSYRPPDGGWGRGRRPVINVSWDDINWYIAWLKRKTGKAYRLLAEAEREYVTRAGKASPFWWGSSITPRQANYNGTLIYEGGGTSGEFRQKTLAVDEGFEPNPWGLYDVHGNVWEWTEDCWSIENASNPRDGSARTTWADCDRRVRRGGSWDSDPKSLRAAARARSNKDLRSPNLGFRVARPLTP
jgi:formylglycine-generating enzyme required for sulfatase activity